MTTADRGLRLLVWDRTCSRDLPWRGSPVGLSHTWWAGEVLYRALGRFDGARAVTTWHEALAWLAEQPAIAEVQYWGHGHWGTLNVASERLDARALEPGSAYRRDLEAVRERFLPDGHWWFRTCDTFGSDRGQAFARRWTDFFGGRASGFTHVIGPFQSGLHSLAAGETPRWSASEGLVEGTPAQPRRSAVSAPWLPNTVTCLAGQVPPGW